MKEILKYLEVNDVPLPSGRLTARRFQQLGIMFGMHGKALSLQQGMIIR